MKTKKFIILSIIFLFLSIIPLTFINRRHFIPSGIGGWDGYMAYKIASYDAGTYTSPDGSWEVYAKYNDAGAAHSGNHYTWIIKKDKWGEQVVAKGWLEPEGLVGETNPFIPLIWTSSNTFTIDFYKSRYEHKEKERVTITLR